MTPDPLPALVRSLFTDLRHAGSAVQDSVPAVRRCLGEAGSEGLGTRVRFTLAVQGLEVAAVRYQAYGCPYTLAVCEWLAREFEAGRSAAIGGPVDWARVLQVPAAKLGRLLVVEDALRSASAQIGPGAKNVVK